MVLHRVDEFDEGGRHFTLYEGGSFILFEEDDEGADGLGVIERSNVGFVVTVWSRPELAISAPTLPEAIRRLVAATDP